MKIRKHWKWKSVKRNRENYLMRNSKILRNWFEDSDLENNLIFDDLDLWNNEWNIWWLKTLNQNRTYVHGMLKLPGQFVPIWSSNIPSENWHISALQKGAGLQREEDEANKHAIFYYFMIDIICILFHFFSLSLCPPLVRKYNTLVLNSLYMVEQG